MRITVPIEVDTRTDDALRMSPPGPVPRAGAVRDGDVVLAELVTFVHRVPTADEGLEDAMPVAMAITTEEPVTLDADARVVIDDPHRDELTALADVLEASTIPLGVRIPPSVLTTLADGSPDDGALAGRLSDAMAADDLVSAPILPLDVSAAAAANEQACTPNGSATARTPGIGHRRPGSAHHRPDRRTAQRGGRRRAAQPRRPSVGHALSIYDDLPDTLGGFTDTTQLVQIQVAPDSRSTPPSSTASPPRRWPAPPPPPPRRPSSRWPICSPHASRCRTRVATRVDTACRWAHPTWAFPRSAGSVRSPPCSPPPPACAPPRSTSSACAPINCSAARVRWW